jgi:5-oxoprolinase (ATP-hydrolysing) subunit A
MGARIRVHNRPVGSRRVDLNADLGEEVTDDEALLAVVTSANVACGFHAGNVDVMRAVCEGAAARGVRVGAQVSYADREGFGRRPLDVPSDVLREQVAEQVQVLSAIAASAGTAVTYVKPHGALYNRVVDDGEQARAVLDGSGALPVLGLPGGRLLALAAEAGRSCFLEAFPDRAYVEAPDGSLRLMPRDRPGAVLHEPTEIARRAVELARGVHSLCVHGDGPTAVAAAHAVRDALQRSGLSVEPFT